MSISAPRAAAEPAAAFDAERENFRVAMRHLVGGVSIITVGVGTAHGGLTATSVTSLSAEPPSLLVCIKQSASGMRLLKSHGRFGVSILGHEHQEIADRFAGRDGSQGADRFRADDWIGGTSYPPVLANALASFECEVEDLIDRFSHTIVIGRVREARALGGDGALVYWRARYESMSRSRLNDA